MPSFLDHGFLAPWSFGTQETSGAIQSSGYQGGLSLSPQNSSLTTQIRIKREFSTGFGPHSPDFGQPISLQASCVISTLWLWLRSEHGRRCGPGERTVKEGEPGSGLTQLPIRLLFAFRQVTGPLCIIFLTAK